MPVTLTKAALNKLMVEERAKARQKAKQSLFMRRTLSIYNAQRKRMQEISQLPVDLPYTLAQFRDWASELLSDGVGVCHYCHGRITIKTLTPDHEKAIADGGSWNLDNLVGACQSCNWSKGRLSGREYRLLLRLLDRHFSPKSAEDVRRRLSLGGKWAGRMFQ